jgi:hypothetical protein
VSPLGGHKQARYFFKDNFFLWKIHVETQATPSRPRNSYRILTETEFLNFLRVQESISRNHFCQPMWPGGPVRQPILTRFLAPIECLKIPAQDSWGAGVGMYRL